ncbi:MAG TPA: nickel-dependent hydrogenase large subunit, partial [Candidatus Limnocylindrales bacterium]
MLRDKIVNLVKAGDVYPFLPRYESSDYIGAPGGPGDVNLATELVGHYVQALEMRKKAHEMIAVFYGRMPSFVGTIPGGVTQQPTQSNVTAFASRLQQLTDWINDVYVADILAIAGIAAYAPFATAGDSGGNYLAYGGFPQNQALTERFLPRGVILNDDIMNVLNMDENKITESVWYSYYNNSTDGLKPVAGKTEPEVTKQGAYSFLKAPRYSGKPMEVGPLARQLVAKPEMLLTLATKLGLLSNNPPKFGILARHAARAIEAKLVADAMATWLPQLKMGSPIWDSKGQDIPDSSKGRGLVEGPRGALGHWITIGDGKTANYQAVVPTTWNASPRDKSGVRGPI